MLDMFGSKVCFLIDRRFNPIVFFENLQSCHQASQKPNYLPCFLEYKFQVTSKWKNLESKLLFEEYNILCLPERMGVGQLYPSVNNFVTSFFCSEGAVVWSDGISSFTCVIFIIRVFQSVPSLPFSGGQPVLPRLSHVFLFLLSL